MAVMSIPDNAVLRKAKNVPVGALVCFTLPSANYRIECIRDGRIDNTVTHVHGNYLQSNTYGNDERLYVVLP
jgi:hypothetical protein